MSEAFSPPTGFVLSCPVFAKAPSPIHAIRKRGNVPLVLQEDIVIELRNSELAESWKKAANLAHGKVDSLLATSANRICDALSDEDNCDMEDLGHAMTDFFLLAIQKHGVKLSQAARSVSIAWNQNSPNHLALNTY
jgi:hypothetical protein